MKKILFCVFCIVPYSVFTQGTIPSVTYVNINSYTSPTINIMKIDDFIKFMNDNKTHNVFVTNNLFLIQGPSVMYTINSNGYKNLEDLKKGSDKNFGNGNSYYFALENNLPNQAEVEYYKSEAFLKNEDYQDATRLGITHSNIKKMVINGLLSEKDLQKNISNLKKVVFLRDYKDWQSMTEQSLSPNKTQINRNGYDSEYQRQINAKNERQRKEKEGLLLLDDTHLDTVINKINNNGNNQQIIKLTNFDYYYLNIQVESEKDCIFYYALKFCQFSNLSEYKNSKSTNTIKNTDQIVSKYVFSTIDAMLYADKINIQNGNDYKLIMEYGLTLDQLKSNQDFISQLESIKNKYLDNFDARKNPRQHNQKATTKNVFAFAIYTLLQQPKSIPLTYSNFIKNVKKDYQNNPLYRNLEFDENTLSNLFANTDSIKNLLVNNSESRSFYLK